MNDRLSELLPWYVNGTLRAEDRAWVEDYLRRNPLEEEELRWYRSLQGSLREDAPDVSDEIGLDRVMNRIHAERRTSPRSRTGGGPSFVERMLAWFGGMRLSIGLTVALAVIAVQAVTIAWLALPLEESRSVRALKPGVVDQRPLLRVNFTPDAKEMDIRRLLVSVRGSLAAGPGQLGDYFIRVPKGRADEAMAKLKASAIVESVRAVAGLPGDE